MFLEIDGWKFDVDLVETMSYSSKVLSDHCQCGYCRNFYQAIDGSYPQLRTFLAQFGMHVETPEELMPFETQCKSPYFVLTSGFLELPWLLDEDMNEVISTANEPEFLEKMWNRLLDSAADSDEIS